MTIDRPECNACCAGRAPYFMCRDKRRLCHLAQDLLAQKKYRAGNHKDPTANRAIGNIIKEQRNKK